MTVLQKNIMIAGIILLSGGILLLVFDSYNRASDLRGSSLLYDHESGELQKAHAQLREGEEYLRQNSEEASKEARTIFNRVLSLDLNQQINQTARFGLGAALERLGDYSSALVHYRKLKAEGPIDRDLADRLDYRLGNVLLKTEREEEGESLLKSLLSRTSDNTLKSDIHIAIANHYRTGGMTKNARENYEVALRYNPDNLYAVQQKEELESKSEKTVKKEPIKKEEYYDDYVIGESRRRPREKTQVVTGLRQKSYDEGIAAFRSGRYSDAVFHLKKVIGAYGDSDLTEKAQYWLGESYTRLGKHDVARRMYEKVLGNNNYTMDQAALIKKGIILFQESRLKEALADFNAASEEYPNGAYTKKALEWRRETESQIRENNLLRSYAIDGDRYYNDNSYERNRYYDQNNDRRDENNERN